MSALSTAADAPPAFDQALSQAWAAHATQPEAVAEQLDALLVLAAGSAQALVRLLALAQHVLGEHLGRWPQGLAWLARARSDGGPHGPDTIEALDRGERLMQLCTAIQAAPAEAWPALLARAQAGQSTAEQLRLQAAAANQLGSQPGGRWLALSGDWLGGTAALAATIGEGDPALRVWASQAHNLSGNLFDLPERSPAADALMIDAARMARQAWARAGTWLQVERADYQLARCLLGAGQPGPARVAAQACADRVAADGQADPFEAFFAAEMLTRCAHAVGDAAGQAAAMAMTAHAWARLDAADLPGCQPTWDELQALPMPLAPPA